MLNCPNCNTEFDVETFILIGNNDIWLCPYCNKGFNEDEGIKGGCIVKIPIDQIEWAKHTMRDNITPESVREIADSIKQVGLEHPIKVRPIDGHYEVVFGHRRLEAYRLLGETEIESQVEDLDNDNAMLQAVIENYHRADAEPMSFAEMLDNLKNTSLYKEAFRGGRKGWPSPKINENGLSKMTGISPFKIRYYLQLLDEDKEVQELVQSRPPTFKSEPEDRKGRITPLHVEWVKRELKDEPEAKTEVLKKAAEEGLTAKQSQQVARKVAKAKTQEEKETLFESSYPTIMATPSVVEATAASKKKNKKKEKEERQENPREVAEYLEALKVFQKAIEKAVKVAEYGKFAPEAGRFVKRKHSKIKLLLSEIEAQLE